MHRFRNGDLFEIWQQGSGKEEKLSAMWDYVSNTIGENIDPSNEERLREKLRRLCRNIDERWSRASRTKAYFKNKNATWLEEHFIFEIDPPTPSTSSGRPNLPFSEKSSRSQRREAARLSHEIEDEASLITQAAGVAARRQGKHDLAAVLKEVNKSPSRPTKIRKILFSPKTNIVNYSAEEALGLILDSNLSKQQYLNIRQGAVLRNCYIYPDYKEVWKCKQHCRPSGIVVSDIMAEVPLCNLLEHTTKRIVHLQEEAIIQYTGSLKATEINAEIIFSYGFDGSSGHSAYKQKFVSSGTHSDASLFATTVIPLRLKTEKHILWNNRTPQSVRFCRPLKLEYVKETADHILKEKQGIDQQIANLKGLKISLPNDNVLNIKFTLFMTLIDGKVLNTLTGTKSSQACPICAARPRDFLNIEDIDTTNVFDPKPDSLQYGISPLHCWIRFFECILHISYRQDIREWQVRGAEKKEIFRKRKEAIQDLFLQKFHLHVDKPKVGFGSTNDGNTARRAFSDIKLFSEISNVDEDLIQKFKIILICLSCSYQLDVSKFGEYCYSTAKLYTAKYPWYPMPATVHKVLIHSKKIIENTVLPIGYFGEEGSEARNKFYKHDRLFHARKTSRQNNMEDVFNRAMDTSDPVISSISLQKRLNRQRSLKLPAEVINMLLEPTQENPESEEEIHTDDDDVEEVLEEILPVGQLDLLELENDL